MSIKVAMIPGVDAINQPSGISRVIENYLKYGKKHGIDFVDRLDKWDIRLAHAGITGGECDVSVLHGLYFTGDYRAPKYEYSVNSMITDAVRSAYAITVPSNWVAEIIQRDTHISPFVVPHGIDCEDWQHDYEHGGYVLYNKNRDGYDVCDSSQLDKLALMVGEVDFISTFSKSNPKNVKVTGVLDHNKMKPLVQKAGAYLSITKETFGIGVLEAMASGVPVLGWNIGGNKDIIKHGETGYLAEYGNYDDLATGLFYIIKYRKVLSENSKIVARNFTWDNALLKLKDAIEFAYEKKYRPVSISVVIPSYNYSHTIDRCINSVSNQTLIPDEIIVVDDGSNDNTEEVVNKLKETHDNLVYHKKENGGVATARNLGAKLSTGKYLCFIDPDDQIDKDFLKVCVDELERDQSVFIAYTRLKWIDYETQKSGVSDWPDEWNFDKQIERKNQVPTCNVMRRDVFDRTGGYRQRYAPHGAGSEDADLWTRAGALGMKAKLVSQEPMFIYSVGSGNVSGNKQYKEMDWLYWHPYVKNGLHPFASYISPKDLSHKVYQFDQPLVSIIIPVGPGHEDKIVDALDSIEGQTYRKWEIIVVSDTDNDIDLTGFPFVRLFKTDKSRSGPGKARNIGVKNSRGKFVIFLDADDYLETNAIELMLANWTLYGSIIYSDYIGVSTIEPENLSVFKDKIIGYDEKLKKALVRHNASDYNCERAQSQPSDPLYHWCIVTCLIPKVWHNEIGGFDESMETWEDVDYHWRMAKAGKCYQRINDPLVYYRFDTGKRRNNANPDTNLETAKRMLAYMSKKYEGIEVMSCYKCGGNKRPITADTMAQAKAQSSGVDDQYILCLYNHPSISDHRVVGPISGIDYGYRSGGDEFLVRKDDIASMPSIFIKKDVLVESAIDVPQEKVEEPNAPTPIKQKRSKKAA